MRILVLDTIHGGRIIADRLRLSGHETDIVDVYRHREGISEEEALSNRYDLVTYPVHLDPCYPLLQKIASPAVTHHQVVRWLLKDSVRDNFIEITGAKGKSTTAAALASLLPGPGILHTSSGLVQYPEKRYVGRHSITPASLLNVSDTSFPYDWIIGEISLGFCGIGSMGILTSEADYLVAGGKKSAIEIKKESIFLVPRVIVPPGFHLSHPGCIDASNLVSVLEDLCTYSYNEMQGSFRNDLLRLPGYKTPLMLAAAAALIKGISPQTLSRFKALPGRMEVRREEGKIILDNSNSGTTLDTTIEAMRFGREISENMPSTLIIGQEASSVCDNFSTEDISSAISRTSPDMVILIPGDPRINPGGISDICMDKKIPFHLATTYVNALNTAMQEKNPLIIMSVKRWR